MVASQEYRAARLASLIRISKTACRTHCFVAESELVIVPRTVVPLHHPKSSRRKASVNALDWRQRIAEAADVQRLFSNLAFTVRPEASRSTSGPLSRYLSLSAIDFDGLRLICPFLRDCLTGTVINVYFHPGTLCMETVGHTACVPVLAWLSRDAVKSFSPISR